MLEGSEESSSFLRKSKKNEEYLKDMQLKIEQFELEYYSKSSSLEIPEINIKYEPEIIDII